MPNVLRAVILELQFWDQDGVPKGFSEWGLFRYDREEVQLPDDAELQRLFQESTGVDGSQLTVRSRIALGGYLYMPIGMQRKQRLAFLQALEAKLTLR